MKAGKKTKENQANILWIKTNILSRLDEVCEMEGCSGTLGLSTAHRMKRRKMPSINREPEARKEEMRKVAYLCGDCHLRLEQGDPQVMFDVVTEVIERREF